MKKYVKLIVFVLLVGVILLLDAHYGWSAYLADMDNLAFLTETVQQNLLEAALIYTAITIVGCVVLALPGMVFAMFAGVLFGPLWGTLFCLVATTIGAVIAFLAGRFFLKDSIAPMVEKNKLLKRLLFDDAGRSDIVILMITRLVPLFPYNLQNFAYGITNISLRAYTVYTFLFMLPGVALFTVGFAGLTASADRWIYFAVAGGLLVLVLLLGWGVKKKFLDAPAAVNEK